MAAFALMRGFDGFTEAGADGKYTGAGGVWASSSRMQPMFRKTPRKFGALQMVLQRPLGDVICGSAAAGGRPRWAAASSS